MEDSGFRFFHLRKGGNQDPAKCGHSSLHAHRISAQEHLFSRKRYFCSGSDVLLTPGGGDSLVVQKREGTGEKTGDCSFLSP